MCENPPSLPPGKGILLSWTRREKYFERVETEASHTLFASQYFSLLVQDSRIPFPGGRDGGFSHIFCKSVIFYPLFLDSRKIFEGVRMENFHTFFASQSFYLLVLDKKQGNNTAYDRIAATI